MERVRIEVEVCRRFDLALGARRFVEVEERLLDPAEGRLRPMRKTVRAGRVTGQAVLGAVAVLASWIPARRAARLDPMIALRAE